jgi:hypothetical protein
LQPIIERNHKKALSNDKNGKKLFSFFVRINPWDDIFQDFCFSRGLSFGLHVCHQLLAYGREPEHPGVRNLLGGLPAEMPEQQ